MLAALGSMVSTPPASGCRSAVFLDKCLDCFDALAQCVHWRVEKFEELFIAENALSVNPLSVDSGHGDEVSSALLQQSMWSLFTSFPLSFPLVAVKRSLGAIADPHKFTVD